MLNFGAMFIYIASAFYLLPVADKLVLTATFDFKLNAFNACDRLSHTEVDAACDGFTWLIEWLSSTQLDQAVIVLAAVSSE